MSTSVVEQRSEEVKNEVAEPHPVMDMQRWSSDPEVLARTCQPPPEKLFVVVRSDLRAGDVLCQSTHAAADWCMAFPGLAARWHDHSNFLVVLAVPDEPTLRSTFERVASLRSVLVTEPDLDDQATAFAVEHAGGRLLSSLPLAMKEPAVA